MSRAGLARVGVSHRDPQSLRAVQGDVDTSTAWFLLVPLALLSLLMHVHTHTDIHIYTHTQPYAHTHTDIHIYTHTQTYTYTHIHTKEYYSAVKISEILPFWPHR